MSSVIVVFICFPDPSVSWLTERYWAWGSHWDSGPGTWACFSRTSGGSEAFPICCWQDPDWWVRGSQKEVGKGERAAARHPLGHLKKEAHHKSNRFTPSLEDYVVFMHLSSLESGVDIDYKIKPETPPHTPTILCYSASVSPFFYVFPGLFFPWNVLFPPLFISPCLECDYALNMYFIILYLLSHLSLSLTMSTFISYLCL